MAPSKSLDESILITTLLRDVFDVHGAEFSIKARVDTMKIVQRRLSSEGIGFLTKTLPRLGKAFDKALAENSCLNATKLRFSTPPCSQLPRFLGELFKRVLSPSGTVLPDACMECVRSIRQICYCFYKYKLPYNDAEEQQVIQKFIRTEEELVTTIDPLLGDISKQLADMAATDRMSDNRLLPVTVARKARRLISDVFSGFDPLDIVPCHGPGAVATKQQLWEKWYWTNISERITDVYPLDAYFYASLGHVCDAIDSFRTIKTESKSARVILVPKDSRGPRLISCEPVDNQWVQQGLGEAIVAHVERSLYTKYNVHFTDQVPNRIGALLGSQVGKYATLDLNEASDRVSLELVRLLFPSHIYTCLEACRTASTLLPSGTVLPLRKFAPMGSALCFPILALCVWALLTAGAPDEDTRERILVYGDDVIVTTAYAADAMNILESFGLKINRDKSCTSGLFRESCGMDAFKGTEVTPVRFRTVWSESRSPDVYTSWIDYSNQFWSRGYFATYNYIVGCLFRIYGTIPAKDMHLHCPSLASVPDENRPQRRRVNSNLQKLEYHVYDVESRRIKHQMPGWSMLLRYFTEGRRAHRDSDLRTDAFPHVEEEAFSVSSYTRRDTSMLVKRWR